MVALDAESLAITFEGARKTRRHLTKARIRWVIVALVLIFGAVGGRLVQLGMVVQDNTIEGQARDLITATRPAILDRNGLELAVDVRVPSLFAEPRRIVDVEEAAQAIHSVLPDMNVDWLRQRLTQRATTTTLPSMRLIAAMLWPLRAKPRVYRTLRS